MRNIPFLTLISSSKYLRFGCLDLCQDFCRGEMILPNLSTAQNFFDRLHGAIFPCIEDLLFELHVGKRNLHFVFHRLFKVFKLFRIWQPAQPMRNWHYFKLMRVRENRPNWDWSLIIAFLWNGFNKGISTAQWFNVFSSNGVKNEYRCLFDFTESGAFLIIMSKLIGCFFQLSK